MNRCGITPRKGWLAPVALVAFAFSACAAATAAQRFALRDGETVVFYGDSITAQRLYTRDVEEFVLTRYPSMHVRFVNAGVPGDTAAGGYTGAMTTRVTRDVAPYDPGMITVMLGMNDGGWGYGSPSKIDAEFQNRYVALLDALRRAAPQAAFTLINPTPYDEITHGTEFPGYSSMIDRLAGDVSRIGAGTQDSSANSIFMADFHRPLVEALEHAKVDDPHLAALLIPDRIHPGSAGHWIMAAVLMSAWHVNPVVSSVALNAADAKVIATERTTVSDLRESAEGFAWTQLDEALPLPLDFNNAMICEILRVSHIAELDRQTLRVSSLKPGKYELAIDGKSVAGFSSEQLENGINLALLKTPMLEQARGIASTEEQRAELDQARFILGADVNQVPTSGIAEATLRAARESLDASMRKRLSPLPHHFVLKLVQTGTQTNGSQAH